MSGGFNILKDVVAGQMRPSNLDIVRIYNVVNQQLAGPEENIIQDLAGLILRLSSPKYTRLLKHRYPQEVGKVLSVALDRSIYGQHIISEHIVAQLLSDLTRYSLAHNAKYTAQQRRVTSYAVSIVAYNLGEQFTIDLLLKIDKRQPTLLQNLLPLVLARRVTPLADDIACQLGGLIVNHIANKPLQHDPAILRFKRQYSSQYCSTLVNILLNQNEIADISFKSREVLELFKELMYLHSGDNASKWALQPLQQKYGGSYPEIAGYLAFLDAPCDGMMAGREAEFLQDMLDGKISDNAPLDTDFVRLLRKNDAFQVQAVCGLICNGRWRLLRDTLYRVFTNGSLIEFVVSVMDNNARPAITGVQLGLHLKAICSGPNCLDLCSQGDATGFTCFVKSLFNHPFVRHDRRRGCAVAQFVLDQICRSEYFSKTIKCMSEVQVRILNKQDANTLADDRGLKLRKIPCGIDLKVEMEIKKSNRKVQEQMQQLLQEENEYRERFCRNITTYLELLRLVTEAVGSDARTMRLIQEQIMDVVVSVFTRFNQNEKYYEELFALLDAAMGYCYLGRYTVPASVSQPMAFLFVLSEIQCLSEAQMAQIQHKIAENVERQCSLRPTDTKYLTLEREKLLQVQFEQYLQVGSLTYPIQTIFPYILAKERELPPAIQRLFIQLSINMYKYGDACVNHHKMLILLLRLNYIGPQHEDAIRMCIEHVMGQQKAKDTMNQEFVRPIIELLGAPDMERRKLAATSLSFLPYSENIITDRRLKLYLLLTEHLSDGTKRFFTLAANRHSFLSNNYELIEQLFDMCSKNQQFQEYMPDAMYSLCEENANKKYVGCVVEQCLRRHLSLQLCLEDTRFDTKNSAASERRCIWKTIERIACFITSYISALNQSLPVGILASPMSKQVFLNDNDQLADQNDIVSRRLALLSTSISEGQYKVVNSLYGQYAANIKKAPQVYVEVDPAKATTFQAIIERYLSYGLFDFDDQAREASVMAIWALIEHLGKQYQYQITYALEASRRDLLQNIQVPMQLIQVCQRLVSTCIDLKKYGAIQYHTIDHNQIKYLNLDSIGWNIKLLSCVAQYLNWEDKTRAVIISLVEELMQLSDERHTESVFVNQLMGCWHSILQGQFVQKPKRAEAPHQEYQQPEEYALDYLIPRLVENVQVNYSKYPSSVHCLAGVIHNFGLSFLIQRTDVLTHVVCQSLGEEEVQQQMCGLQLLLDLIIKFQNLIEPYIPIFAEDVLSLAASPHTAVCELANTLFAEILKHLTQFGIQHISQVIINSLMEDNNCELLIGATQFIYSICCNKAKLPVMQFKHMLSKLIPQFLPSLQKIIYHPQIEVKDNVLKTLYKITELVQSPNIRSISKQIVEAYLKSDIIRNVLIDISELQFTANIDAASLALIYPLCERVLNRDSSTFFNSAGDRLVNVHIKSIAANVLGLLSDITSPSDFSGFVQPIEQVLVKNLSDTNEEVRQSCAINLANIIGKVQNRAQLLFRKLIHQMNTCDMVLAHAHGVSLALVDLGFMLGNWQILLGHVAETLLVQKFIDKGVLSQACSGCGAMSRFSCDAAAYLDGCTFECNVCGCSNTYERNSGLKDANIMHIALYLLYVPQKLLELKDVGLIEYFVTNYFLECLTLLFHIIEIKKVYAVHEQLLQQISRQLCTSFLEQNQNCKVVCESLTKGLLHNSYNVRELSITLVGDLISELGASVLEKPHRDEKEEIKQIRQAINEIKVTGIADQRVKVFIPEKSISHAILTLGADLYHKLTLNLFLVRYDQTGNIRHQAVNMWKLITVKPISTISGFMPYALDAFVELLRLHYTVRPPDIDYKQIIELSIGELYINITATQMRAFCKQIDDAMETCDQEKLVCLLDIYAFIAKNDKNMEYVHESLIARVPAFIKNSSSEELINSAATLLSSVQVDVSSIINDIVLPQIEKIQDAASQEELQQIATSVNLIIGQKYAMINQLVQQCILGERISQNQVRFVACLFKVSTLLQENARELIGYCNTKLQQDGGKILLSVQHGCGADQIHPVLGVVEEIIKFSAEMPADQLAQDTLDAIAGRALEALPMQSLEVQAPAALLAALLLADAPLYVLQSKAVLAASIQCAVSNLAYERFAGVAGFTFSAYSKMYRSLSGDKERLGEFLQPFVGQFLPTLQTAAQARSCGLEALPAIHGQLLDLFQVFAGAQSSQQAGEQTKVGALKTMVTVILMSLHAQQLRAPTQEAATVEFDGSRYAVPRQSGAVGPLANAVMGRIVMICRMELGDDHRGAVLRAVDVLARTCPVQQFESICRPDIEKYCLLHGNRQIQDLAVAAVYSLYTISARKEQNIHSLVNIIFSSADGQVGTINLNLGHELLGKIMALLAKMIHNSQIGRYSIMYRQRDIKFSDENIYVELADMFWQHVMLADDVPQVLFAQAGYLIASCCERLVHGGLLDTYELLLMRIALCRSDYTQTSCGQLIVLRQIIRIGLESGCHDRLSRLARHASENIQSFNAQQTNKSLHSRLQERLDIQTDGQLVEVAEIVRLLGYFLVSSELAGDDQWTKQLKLLLAQSVQLLTRKFAVSPCNVKEAVLDLLCTIIKFLYDGTAVKSTMRTQVGIFTIGYLQKCLMDQEVGQYAQRCFIDYYNLRFGTDVFDQVANVVRQSNAELVDDMQYRISTIQKLIKKGAL